MKSSDRSLAEGILFTDQYELTMAQLYYRAGIHEKTGLFEHFFRSYPDYGQHKAGYCINAGLEWFIDWAQAAHFGDQEIDYLRTQKNRSGQPLFAADFLEWLRANGSFEGISLSAIPEGRVVHPEVPLTMVQGPLAMAQIMETALLNMLNYQTLIATKAARIRESGRGQVLMDFGMRRAQDLGANAGTRAALIGGADFSSNVGISAVLGFPPKGTQAHSMIQAFIALGGSELDAFRAYAELYPDDCLLLVDTIHTLESGVPNAIKVFEELKRKGHMPLGIRLDSGDLAYLTIQAAQMLNEAGFADTQIVWSNELDELIIWQILTQIEQEAPRYGLDPNQLIRRLSYGVGTRLITSAGDPALDGVYKLVGMRVNGSWAPAIKISESPAKTLNPGRKHAWRLYDRRNKATADLLSLADEEAPRIDQPLLLRHPSEAHLMRTFYPGQVAQIEPLHVDVLREGKLVYEFPTFAQIREQRQGDLDRLDPGVKRLINPHIYHVSLTEGLWALKQELIMGAREKE